MSNKTKLLPLSGLRPLQRAKRVTLVLLVAMLGTLSGMAQSITVHGHVSDDAGEPVIGATVMEKGSKGNGVITDLDGNYHIVLKGNNPQRKGLRL